MLFHVTWEFIDTREESQRRSLAVFQQWQAEDVEFKGFFGFADGTGGVALVEANDAEALFKTTAPWTPWLRFTAKPILAIEDSTRISLEAQAFRDSVG
jgi:hypothetical protein